jgi:hypothetical protein
MKILYLCATDQTAKKQPPRLQSYVEELYPDEYDFENYFIGLNLNMFGKYYCKGDVKKNITNQCNYDFDSFDIVVSEFCPTTYLTILNETFFDNLRLILKKGGIFIVQYPNITTIKNKNYDKQEFIDEMKKLGYEVLKILESSKYGITKYISFTKNY